MTGFTKRGVLIVTCPDCGLWKCEQGELAAGRACECDRLKDDIETAEAALKEDDAQEKRFFDWALVAAVVMFVAFVVLVCALCL